MIAIYFNFIFVQFEKKKIKKILHIKFQKLNLFYLSNESIPVLSFIHGMY